MAQMHSGICEMGLLQDYPNISEVILTSGNPFAYLGRKGLPCGKHVYLVMFTEFFGGNVHLDGFYQ